MHSNFNDFKTKTMEYKDLVKHHTQLIKDQNDNKWEVIETSDLEEICEAYHQAKALASVMHWVVVDERLPNEHQDIMVYYYGNKNSKHFPNLQFMKQSSFYNGQFECDEEVTHWAELPEPPCA